jgi:ferritin
MVQQLNKHINLEAYSSNLYLQMSGWCEVKGLDGCAAFLRAHAQEEMGHLHRLFQYVYETGNMPLVGEVKAPPTEFPSVGDMFRQVYDHEVFITGKINELVSSAVEQEDHSTVNFLQWYVAEQHEEEHIFQQILDKIKIIGEEGTGVYFIDKTLGEMAKQVE